MSYLTELDFPLSDCNRGAFLHCDPVWRDPVSFTEIDTRLTNPEHPPA